MQFKSLFSVCLLGQAGLAVAQAASDASGSKTLPPSPTGSGACEPHGDHWHCHAASSTAAGSVDTVTASATAQSCVPHDDHWHCPPGVSKPATSPAQTQTQTQSGAKPTTTETDHDHDHDHDHDYDHDHHGTDKECTPHNDHWHCPSGISAPTFPPTAIPSTSAAKSSGATSAGAANTTAAVTTTAAAKALAGGRPTVSAGSVGVAIAASLAGAFVFGTMLV
ncbi:hypothetical protein EsDP_00007011 [Epichloe bromicola]|uniref:Uncharacterized protein n=1 Tax=Epichloe bromicola TaxID=79588 RepID=A0ABQ0CZM2_9HYPO